MTDTDTHNARVEERERIERVKRGDREAFRELYDAHLPQVSRTIMRMIGPGPDFDDIVQEVFIQMYRSIGRFEYRSAFSTWLIGITRHVCSARIRKQRPSPVDITMVRNLTSKQDEWRRLEARQRVRTLHAILEALPEEQRRAFVLHQIEGLTLEETAAQLERPVGTVAAWVSRARAAVRDAILRADKYGRRTRAGGSA